MDRSDDGGIRCRGSVHGHDLGRIRALPVDVAILCIGAAVFRRRITKSESQTLAIELSIVRLGLSRADARRGHGPTASWVFISDVRCGDTA